VSNAKHNAAVRALYAKLETMPGLQHGGAGDTGADDYQFDPAASPVVNWLRENLDQVTLHCMFFWVLRKAGAIYWDTDKKVWRGRSVADYEKKRAEKLQVKQAEQAAKAAAKAAKPKGRPGRSRDVPTDILCDAVQAFAQKHRHDPTSMELLAEMKTEDFVRDLPGLSKPISDSTFWKRYREGRAAPETATNHLALKPAMRGTRQVEEIISTPEPVKP
jgi:hypothetical protein